MLVVVTGAAGFIGSHVVDRLLEDGHTVRGVDCFTPNYARSVKVENLGSATKSVNFALLPEDLRDAPLASLLDGADAVVHLAGQPGVRTSWGPEFKDYMGHNVLATQRLLEACVTSNIQRFVYGSSSSVYGNATRYPTREDDLPAPVSPYGVTKLAGEHLVSLYAEHGVPSASLRFFTVYGPRQRPDMAFHRFLRAGLRNEPLQIYGTGDQRRQFTFVLDVVEAIMRAVTHTFPHGEVMNVAGGTDISVNELVASLSEVLGTEVRIEHAAPQPGDVDRTGGDSSRAAELLGWTPTVGIREGLDAELAWLRTSM